MRDYNPRRYRTSTRQPGENRERMLTAAVAERDKARAEVAAMQDTIEVLDRAVRNLTRQVDVAIGQQHRYRIAFMLFAQQMQPDTKWQELWVKWLMRANDHIGDGR